jgi:8-oxo-dGTP diphosphatase
LTASDPLHVAVGVILNEHDQVLISKRHEHSHMGGLWEFPGGKVEAEESVEDALRRELLEELGIEPEQLSPLLRVHHHYSDKFVLLDVWEVIGFRGKPEGREGQSIRWQALTSLDPAWFPEANHAIIRKLQLPGVLWDQSKLP